jgi:hypothetical protein
MVTRQTPVLSDMQAMLALNPYLASFTDISNKIDHLGREKDRRYLLSLCEQVFGEVSLRRDEPSRVAAAKIMVALIPDSIDSIRNWINSKSGKSIYEIHFSLFCFLDQVPGLRNGKEFAREIPPLIQDYLLDVKSKSAFAAFMAGDLLGDHWEVSEALPILIRAAKGARYVAGRKGAIHGLAHILNRLSESDTHRGPIISLLRNIRKRDNSKEVRVSANLVLERKII